MSKFKTFLIAGGLIAALGTNAANAALTPTLSYEAFLNGTLVASSSATGGTLGGTAAPADLPPGFSALSFNANGVPVLMTPNFAAITSISTASNFTGTQTIELLVSQTNLTMPVGMLNVNATIDENNRLGSVGVMATLKDYIDTDNVAFAKTLLVASLDSSPGRDITNGADGTTLLVNVTTAAYSETSDFVATFTGPNETIQTNNQLLVNVPEPASIALIGTALFGFGLVRRRRNRS